jgi:hypothetical protein
MKSFTLFFIGVLLLFITACSGSDVYRGNWKAMDPQGNKFNIDFQENSFTIKDSAGVSTKFEYTQNSVNINNGVETYGIQLNDGRAYSLNFPIADDESKGTISDGNGYISYTISRKDFQNYDELFKLK